MKLHYKFSLTLYCIIFFVTGTFPQSTYQKTVPVLMEECADLWTETSKNRKQVHLDCLEGILEQICVEEYSNDSILHVLYSKLAYILLEKGYFSEANFYSRASLNHAEAHYGNQNIELVPTLHALAIQEEVSNNNFLASILVRQRIQNIGNQSEFDSISRDQKTRIVTNTSSLAYLYVQTGQFRLAREKLLESKERWQKEYFNNIDQFEYDLMHSYATFKIGYPEEAFPVMRHQVTLFDSLAYAGEYVINEQIIGKLVLAEIAIALDQFELAKTEAAEAVGIQQQYIPEALGYESYAKYIQAKTWLANHEYEAVPGLLEPILKKFEALTQEAHQQVNFVDIAQLYELLVKAKIQEADSTKHLAPLYQALAYSKELAVAVDIAWRNLKNQDDLRFTLQQYFEFFETPLELHYRLYEATDSVQYLEQAIQLMERTRNIQLRASLRRSDLAKELGVPSHLLTRQQKLQQQLFDKTLQLEYLAPDSPDKAPLEEEILRLKNQRQTVTDEIDAIAPDLSRAVHRQRSLTLDQLRVQLAPGNQSVLFYTVGEKASFVIALNADETSFKRIAIGRQELQEKVNLYRSAIYNNPDETTATERQDLADISHQLYSILVAPVADKLTSRLVIVPDGPLEVLPFSSLNTQLVDAAETPLSKWPFLLRKFSFNYAYALELLLQNNSITNSHPQQKILAFAPDFEDVNLRGIAIRSRGSLKANQEEIAFIEDQFQCDAHYGKKAQLSTFLEKATDYAVLHLATHAVANDQIGAFSYLSFSETEPDHDLEVGDLYGMRIPAAMVVLSACETGLGEWQRGEGIVGLERAFFYAGAQSLVTTHWKVSDRASAKLMSFFYDHLNSGLPKDVALQQAQLTFISEHDNWLSHPFFWAAFVQKGKTAPLAIPKRTSYWKWLLAGGLLLAFAGFSWNRRAVT